MVHYHPPVPVQQRPPVTEEVLVGLTAEEAGLDLQESENSGDVNADFLPSCSRCGDKENYPPSSELTYLDLDKTGNNVLKERSNLKRRRAVAEWETEEAVQSILPKKCKKSEDCCDSDSSSSSSSSSSDDSVFLDDATLLSDIVSKEVEEAQKTITTTTNNVPGSAMEIDRITSLVSIFSFSMGGDNNNKLNRSVSTPDLCSAQAKDCPDSIQQRPFLAMTV